MTVTGTLAADWAETHPDALKPGTTRAAIAVLRAAGDRDLTDETIADAASIYDGHAGLSATKLAQVVTSVRAIRKKWIEWHTGMGTPLVEHRLRVRADHDVVLRLPIDLTAAESERLGQWMTLLGVDEPPTS